MSTRDKGDRVELLQGTLDRRAKFYRLTAKGRNQLCIETSKWEIFALAISKVLRTTE